jgi:3-deoxy-D-manno-octulosonic acid (KDO) 8-phosphate synthase
MNIQIADYTVETINRCCLSPGRASSKAKSCVAKWPLPLCEYSKQRDINLVFKASFD